MFSRKFEWTLIVWDRVRAPDKLYWPGAKRRPFISNFLSVRPLSVSVSVLEETAPDQYDIFFRFRAPLHKKTFSKWLLAVRDAGCLAVVSINYIFFKRFDHDQEPSNLNKLSNEFCFINLVFDIRCRWKDYIIHSKTDGLAWCVVSSSCRRQWLCSWTFKIMADR